MSAAPSVFDFSNYLEFLESLVIHRDSEKRTRAQLATAMGCQPAYFSQVLKGRVHLTEDHGVRLCQFLGYDEEATDFFLLLLRKERAGTPTLTSYLETKRRRLAEARKNVEGRISSRKQPTSDELSVYYSADWIPSAIHLATSCADYQTPAAIAARLQLPQSLIEIHLSRLEAFELVVRSEGKWQHAGASIHFPKASPLDHHFQMSRRLQALGALSKREEQNLHYSVSFAADSQTLTKLRELFVESIARMHRQVEPAPSDDVFALTLDLFRV